MTAKTMACTQCWQTLAYPDAFPSSIMAICWRCTWNDHIHSKHPRDVKRIRKSARKRAVRLSERNILDAMFDDELDQAIGTAAAAAHREAKKTPESHRTPPRSDQGPIRDSLDGSDDERAGA